MQHTHNAALLEREDEQQQLDRLVDDASSGRGRVVLVEGPPGIGKTRLLEVARVNARERGMVALSARASELDRDFPFGVVRQLFEPLLASADAARCTALLRGAAGGGGPLLGRGSPERDATATGGDPSVAQFHSLYWLTANLAEEAPVALVIDDIHWADASSLRFGDPGFEVRLRLMARSLATGQLADGDLSVGPGRTRAVG